MSQTLIPSTVAPLPPSTPSLACAIYTRKSSEEGLEQDFNSLHAQREACEAFILSQRSLGWMPSPTAYDDGGFSGGNVERPGLRRLIADIEAGEINVIVVYKVDRLTRSLADFAKLVELFDEKGVSFVSVTQQFNTTTSMGRLTLNVLLSFAQFEREVTGERIRDKIAASKRKGMWMGGVPPVGYRAQGRSLEPDDSYCHRVREVYELYLELGCIRRLSEEVRSKGWLTPERENKRVGFGGKKAFSRGHLHRILTNPIYAGMIQHKGVHYPGQHPPIVARELWSAVQERLECNRQGKKVQSRERNASLLCGKLFDETGRRFVSSHTTKGAQRYRYYVTLADEVGEPIRLAAQDIEELVCRAVVNWASSDVKVLEAVGSCDAHRAAIVLRCAKHLCEDLQAASSKGREIQDRFEALRSGVTRVEVGPTAVRIMLDAVACLTAPKQSLGVLDGLSLGDRKQCDVNIEVQTQRRRVGAAVRLVVRAEIARLPSQPDPALQALMSRGAAWLQRLALDGQSIEAIAEQEKLSARYVSRVINVALLAPDIVQAIMRGDHSSEINATRLITAVPLPMDFSEQRQMLAMNA